MGHYAIIHNVSNKRKEVINIDKRKHYILVVDTETANTIQDGDKLDMSNVLVYDCGWQVVDKHGTVYHQASYVNRDIFVYERDLMQSAYYANKIPQYIEDIRNGKRIMASTYEIRKAMLADMEFFNIKEVAAHNARFDLNALNNTFRYITKSKFRYWFPYDTIIWDTMRMARSVIHKMPTYIDFCTEHDYFSATGKPKTTAEILWRYISHNNDFIESHTGLEDVEIEAQIMAYCFKQHKQIDKELYPHKGKKDPPTDFQKMIMRSIKQNPVLAGF